MRPFGFVLALTAAAMFGLGAVLAKILGQAVDAVIVGLLCLFVGGLLLVACLLLARKPVFKTIASLTKAQWGQLFLLSFVGTALPLLLIVIGFARTSAIEGGFVLQLNGVSALIFALALLKERIRFQQSTGIVLLLLGSILVILKNTASLTWSNTVLGDLLILAGAVGLGYGFIPAKRLVERIDALSLTALRLLFGACTLLPALAFQAIFYPDQVIWHLTPAIFWALPCYIVTNFCLGYLTQQEGLRLLKAWEMGAIMQTVPLFSTLAAILLLNDTLTLLQIVGGAIALSGGLVVSFSSLEKR